MKYIILLCDGMADDPLESLGGKTPMEAAFKPCMEELAKKSTLGMVNNVPDDMKPGSDVANLSVLGYNPKECYTGRSPLEAGSLGLDMNEQHVSFRCNLVTLSDEENFNDKRLIDYCSGDIETEQARIIVNDLNRYFACNDYKFYPGTHYRHCLLWENGTTDLGDLVAPHDIQGEKIRDHLPNNQNALWITDLMEKASQVLTTHSINTIRVENGLPPANGIWLWGEGKRASLQPFEEKFGIKGSIISAVDLLKGIGKFARMSVVEVEGATGYIDTNYNGKYEAAIAELRRGQDLVYIHVEAPDECGHRGETANKVKSIEDIDKFILAPLIRDLDDIGEPYKVLILPDHPTPIAKRTHTSEAVPFLLFDSLNKRENENIFSEKTAEKTGFKILNGYNIMEILLKNS